MYFTMQITINRPRWRVIELIGNPEHFAKWQPGLISVELLSGERDQAGARSRVVYEWSGVHLEVIETVIKHSPPDVFVRSFEARGVRHLSESRFIEEDLEVTRWISINDFKATGLMSLMGVVLNEIMPKQVLDAMNRFKRFAESS